jgi:hypothetical protein
VANQVPVQVSPKRNKLGRKLDIWGAAFGPFWVKGCDRKDVVAVMRPLLANSSNIQVAKLVCCGR